MTVSSTDRTAGPFEGDDAQTDFPFTMRVFTAADILATQTDADGIVTTLMLGSDYTVALNADQRTSPGGTLTLLAALPTGETLEFTTDIQATQGTRLTSAGGFYPSVIEDALDKLTILVQQHSIRASQQALRAPEIGGVPALPAAAVRANTQLLFDANGDPYCAAPASGSAADVLLALASNDVGDGSGLVGFDPTLNYAVATIGAALRCGVVYPHLFPWLAPTDGSDAGPAIRACIAANPGRTIYLSRAGGATYSITSRDAGAGLTLAALGTRLTGDPSVKLLFTDAAAYGINVTAGLCRIDSLMLWGTNTTAPTITALVHVATTAPNCTVANCNLAYAATAEHVESYIFRSIANSFSNCDRYLYTSGGDTADIQVIGDCYGTTHIGTNAVVEIAGSGGADIQARWEMMGQGKLALSVQTTGQRVIVHGKMENSGGIYVGANAWLRLDVEALDSYYTDGGANKFFIDLAAGGGRVDATGSTLNGPGSTSGVTCVRSSSNFIMGSGTIEQWQVAGDFNADGNVNIGDVTVSACTSGWDASSGTSGKVGPCTYFSVTTPITRGAGCDVNFVDGWTGKSAWTPGTIAAGSFATVTLTVTGVLPGDDGLVTYDQDLGGCTLHHQVRTDSIVVLARNPTGAGIPVPAGNLRYKVSGKAA